MNATSTFIPSKYRRTRSPLTIAPLYDIWQPSVFENFHAVHITMTEAEAEDLRQRAEINMRMGDLYIPTDLYPESLRAYHCI